MDHPWFAGFEFTKLKDRQLQPQAINQDFFSGQESLAFFNAKGKMNDLKQTILSKAQLAQIKA